MLDRFRAASPNQQFLAAVGGICLLAVLLFVGWFTFLRTTYQPLFSDLKVSDASTIVAELDRRKVPYRLAHGGTTILVASGIVDSTRLTVMGSNVPLRGTVGFELFNKTDMGLTDFAQKINYQRALQGELERTIMTLDGVDTARVHLSLGEDRLFRDNQVAPKASVTIRMAKGSIISERAAQGVRRLVAAAVPKMDGSDVVILDERGQAISAPVANSISIKPATPAQEEKHAIEKFYEGRIRESLAGAGMSANIAVDVTAEIFVAAAGASVFSRWAPATRDFPLQVILSSTRPLDNETQNRVRALVGEVTSAPAAKNDIITFGIAPTPDEPIATDAVVDAETINPPRAVAMPLGSDEAQGATFDWMLVAIPMFVVLLAGFLLLRKLRGPSRLSAKRQADFVKRLRILLEERDGHAAPRS